MMRGLISIKHLDHACEVSTHAKQQGLPFPKGGWCEHHGADTATNVQVQRMASVPKEIQENHGYLVLEEDFVIRVLVGFLFYILE